VRYEKDRGRGDGKMDWNSRETLGRSGGSLWSGIGVVSGSHLSISVVHDGLIYDKDIMYRSGGAG
jgi:hypothetical protein